MTGNSMDIAEAIDQINRHRFDDLLREEHVIKVTREGKEAFALVDAQFLEAILETIDIISDPESNRVLAQSKDDIRHGRLHSHEDVKRDLL